MTILKSVGKFLLGGVLGSVLGGGSKKKVAKQASPLPIATRDDAAGDVARADELRRRQGGAADLITGKTGAEAVLGTGKFILGN